MSSVAFTAFGEDDHSWNADTDCNPGICLVALAIQVWAVCRAAIGISSSIGEAAMTFNLPMAMIVQAVEHHQFMHLEGPADDPASTIGHDGE